LTDVVEVPLLPSAANFLLVTERVVVVGVLLVVQVVVSLH
jgi:hypothetical protein